MIHTIFLPYTGDDKEIQALRFARMLSDKLKADVDAAFVSGALHVATKEGNVKVAHVYEAQGYYASQDFSQALYAEDLKKKAAGAKSSFAAFNRGSPNETRLNWAGEIDLFYDTERKFQKYTCLHDLTLASFHLSAPVYSEVVDSVLFAAGRPVLFVNDAGEKKDELTVVIGWKPSAQSIHAIMAALPILKVASKCHLVTIKETKDKIVPSAGDVAAYLAAKGVDVESHTYSASDGDAHVLLSKHYKKVGANLLVMGAYSHSRMKELVFGGFTRHFLNNRECNVLMAH